jgi:6-phosphogluconolactonase
LSWAAAARFEELARLRAIKKSVFSVALSGGSTPKLLYEILGGTIVAPRIRWQYVQFFQVDERAVPPDHPESNYRMIREALLDQISIPEANVHRMEAEKPDRESACREYSQQLARTLAVPPGERPRLDLVVLGMGADGHTASLFPGTPATDEKALWVRANYVEKLNAHRLTLTFPVLNAAHEVMFLVAGAEKAEALRDVLEGPPCPERLPAQRVHPVDGRLSWYVDEAAARLLTRVTRTAP